jgi:hypothetical protein
MSEKKIFKVSYVEYPETTLIYAPLKIDISNYPELEGKTDDEIIDYIKLNAYKMKATDDFYDSLGEELSDQAIIREKVPHVGSEFWIEPTDEDNNDEGGEDAYDDDYED